MNKTPIEKLQEVAILAKSHVDSYTKKDGTFVAAHEDKRTKKANAPKAVEPVPVPDSAKQMKASFEVKKVGNKWLTVTHPGKTYQMQLAIGPETAHFAVGDKISDLPVGKVEEYSKYGSKVTWYPLPSGTKPVNKQDIEKWLGYVESKVPEGYVYQNGVDKLKDLGAMDIPEYRERIEAAIAGAKQAKKDKEASWASAKEKAKADDAAAKAAKAKAAKDADEAAGIKTYHMWSGKEGFGIPKEGQVINRGDQYMVVTDSSSGRYFGEDASSLGGSDYNRWQFRVKARPATDEEAAPLKAKEAEQKAQEQHEAFMLNGKKALSALGKQIQKEGVLADKGSVADGDIVHDTFDIYGGGERIVIGSDKIWSIRNNGMDGDDWSANNISTGGAGAIGWFAPKTPELERKIRNAVKQSKGEQPEPEPASKNPWTDDQWAQLHIPESNANHSTHKRQLDQMRAHAEAGDVDALKKMTFGVNTYGKKRAKIHAALLEAMGEKPLRKAFLIIKR